MFLDITYLFKQQKKPKEPQKTSLKLLDISHFDGIAEKSKVVMNLFGLVYVPTLCIIIIIKRPPYIIKLNHVNKLQIGNIVCKEEKFWVTQKLPQIYTANHATFPIQIRKIKVQICGNFWVTQYIKQVATSWAQVCTK